MSLYHAVEIPLPGITSNSTTVGMSYDSGLGYSCTRWITGRPAYNGSTTIPTIEGSGSIAAVWYNGILLAEGLGNPNRSVDLNMTGGYGTMSGFTCSVSNAMIPIGVGTGSAPFWKICESLGINFFNRVIKHYVVIDDVFYYSWQGIVSEVKRDDIAFKLVCIADFKSIHKNIPPITINDTNYPDAVADSKGKNVPVCLGRIPYSRVYNTNGNPDFINLVYDGSNYHQCAQATNYYLGADYSSVRLKTPRIDFGISNQLTGKYLICIGGGGAPDKTRCYKITGSSTNNTDPPADWQTYVYLEEPLDVDMTTFNDHYVYKSTTYLDIWQFKIADIGRESIVSNLEIDSFKTKSGRVQGFDYDSDSKQYVESHSVASGDVGSSTTQPTIVTNSNLINTDGNIKTIVPIKITGGQATTAYTWPGATVTTVGNISDVTDFDRSTFYQSEALGTILYSGDASMMTMASFTIPEDVKNSSIDKLWILADYQIQITDYGEITAATNTIFVQMADSYGDYVYIPVIVPSSASMWIDGIDRNLIPNGYYEDGGDYNGESSLFDKFIESSAFVTKTKFEISSAYLDLIKQNVFSTTMSIYIEVIVYSLAGVAVTKLRIKMKEVAVIGVREVDTIGTGLYARINGEVNQSENDAPTDTLYGAFRHLLANYDGLSVSSGNPAFDVDIDNLALYRHNATYYKWYFGYQFQERKNLFEYYNDMCKTSFCSMFQTRTGQKKITAWLYRTDYNHATLNGSYISKGSFKSLEKSPSSDIFNDFLIKYNFDQAENACTRTLLITKTDESSFPAASTLDSNNNPLWWQYVGGIVSYANAKILWDLCHIAYGKTRVVQQFKIDLPFYPDLRIYEDNQALTDGAGDDSAAYYFLWNCIMWLTTERTTCKFSVPLTAANMTMELCDPIKINHSVYTYGIDRAGYITGIEVDTEDDALNLTALLLSY